MSSAKSSPVLSSTDLPEEPSLNAVYRLGPKGADEKYYRERTDRNFGWITRHEQEILRKSVVGVAGCGGMGGLLATTFFRLGVGEVRIADSEVFDVSNLNRQYAAERGTIGLSKAIETARRARAVTDDATLMVFPRGINDASVGIFLEGCDLVCDEIEFWAVGSRLLLHEEAYRLGVPLFNCNSEGAGTRLFLFDEEGESLREMLGISLAEAMHLEKRIQGRNASRQEAERVMKAMLAALAPGLPEYCPEDSRFRTHETAVRRLLEENRAPIIATNPVMAAGFLANHVLLHLLRRSGVERSVVRPPKPPGYLYFDSWFMKAEVVERSEVAHEL